MPKRAHRLTRRQATRQFRAVHGYTGDKDKEQVREAWEAFKVALSATKAINPKQAGAW
jgi:hypothetical protein